MSHFRKTSLYSTKFQLRQKEKLAAHKKSRHERNDIGIENTQELDGEGCQLLATNLARGEKERARGRCGSARVRRRRRGFCVFLFFSSIIRGFLVTVFGVWQLFGIVLR